MTTPDGRECKHYYEDFHRGRDIQKCRLVERNPESERWHPNDCAKCPVPDILRANADPNMELEITIKKGFLGFGRRIEVTAKDITTGEEIADPYVGSNSNKDNNLDIFRQALEDVEDDD